MTKQERKVFCEKVEELLALVSSAKSTNPVDEGMVRTACQQLLVAVKANGHGGCRLCMG